MWYILYTILEAGAYVESKGMELGHVHPNNIVLSENGKIKIISKYSCTPKAEE